MQTSGHGRPAVAARAGRFRSLASAGNSQGKGAWPNTSIDRRSAKGFPVC